MNCLKRLPIVDCRLPIMGEQRERWAMPVAPLDAALVFAARKPPPSGWAALTETPLKGIGTRRPEARATMKITKRTQNQNREYLVNQCDPHFRGVWVGKTNPNLPNLGLALFPILLIAKRGGLLAALAEMPLQGMETREW